MNKRKSGMSFAVKLLIGIAVVILLIIALFAMRYNSLVNEEENVKTEYSNISVQLQRRNDLIPNLVNTVQAYAAHETEVFQAVTDARERMMNATTVDGTAAADAELTTSLNRLLAISEAYPDLKANENFLSLQDQLEGTENRISIARRDYNAAVNIYNSRLRSFPTNIVASLFGFKTYDLFVASEGAQTVPEVNFE